MQNSVICKVCSESFESDACLHKHLKVHKIYMAEYYQTYFPRYDKFDGKMILFKNKDQYLMADFNSRENLRLWIEQTEPPIVRAYCKMVLEQRRDRKNLKWAPTQVELRTVMLPPIQCYNDLFGNYFLLCEELGLKNRVNPHGVFAINSAAQDYVIYVDTREQRPLTFPHRFTKPQALKFGDYACDKADLTCNCYIERKSAHDFGGTFSGGVERFRRELDRAVEAQAYMVVLVEDTLKHCLDPNRQTISPHKSRRATVDFIFHNVRDILQDYPNVQFLFVGGREKAAEVVEKIFESGCSYKDVDLQYLYDLGRL